MGSTDSILPQSTTHPLTHSLWIQWNLKPFFSEFLKRTHPSLNMVWTIVPNKGFTQKKKHNNMANSVDPDETAHDEPSHQNLRCLLKYTLVCRAERIKRLSSSVCTTNFVLRPFQHYWSHIKTNVVSLSFIYELNSGSSEIRTWALWSKRKECLRLGAQSVSGLTADSGVGS